MLTENYLARLLKEGLLMYEKQPAMCQGQRRT
jgi:hypothetical protein